MENAVQSLNNLFKVQCFNIPEYQRAYSWEQSQTETFLADLRQQVVARKQNANKNYFLGTLLLHNKDNNSSDIVDGQQRLTTSVIFIASALQAWNKIDEKQQKSLKEYFIYSDIEEKQKLRTIADDNAFFSSEVLKIGISGVTEDSPSSRRLLDAYNYFTNNVSEDEWGELIGALTSAQVMVYAVGSPADATLIFELQNDRGKSLTDLESLKSYLMHLIYLHAKNPDDSLKEIQSLFSKIYRYIERLNEIQNAPTEDALLSYHAIAWLDWSKKEWRAPKSLVKQVISAKESEEIPNWVRNFVRDLLESFKTTAELLTELDSYQALSELYILDRMAVFWPLVIKSFKKDQTKNRQLFHGVCRLMEVFAMRGFGMANLRSDTGESTLNKEARDFDGDYESLSDKIFDLCYEYDIENRFTSGLDSPALFTNNKRDARYLLWRYENHLRAQSGQQTSKLNWKQFLAPEDDATRLSIEHIAAQDSPIVETDIEWEAGTPEKLKDVALHRLGNLVLDTKSANSSKGKKEFEDKLEKFLKQSTYLSQSQLSSWAKKEENGSYSWTSESIKARHKHLTEFAKETWDPKLHYKRTPIEES